LLNILLPNFHDDRPFWLQGSFGEFPTAIGAGLIINTRLEELLAALAFHPAGRFLDGLCFPVSEATEAFSDRTSQAVDFRTTTSWTSSNGVPLFQGYFN